MWRSVRKHGQTVVVAVVASAVTAAAPTIAASFDAEWARRARDADRVDGFHAVQSSTRVKARAGKLVATNARGYLPESIVLTRRFAPILRAQRDRHVDPTTFSPADPRPIEVNAVRIAAPISGYLLITGSMVVEGPPGTEVSLTPRIEGVAMATAGAVGRIPTLEGGPLTLSYSFTTPIEKRAQTISQAVEEVSAAAETISVNRNHLSVLFVPGPQGELG